MEGFKAVQGNTYPVKEQLKALGARWSTVSRVWMIPIDRLEEANDIIRNAPQPESRGHGTDQATKKCWECGRRFTRAECNRYGGDWSESYCGC